MKVHSAYEADVARVYVIEVSPAVVARPGIEARNAVTEEVRWGLDVPEADSFRETQRIFQQRSPAGTAQPIRRRLTQREGRDL
mgnify:CR=1 FL=1